MNNVETVTSRVEQAMEEKREKKKKLSKTETKQIVRRQTESLRFALGDNRRLIASD